jgi:hypothetical protein
MPRSLSATWDTEPQAEFLSTSTCSINGVDRDLQFGPAEVAGESGDEFIIVGLGAAAVSVAGFGEAAEWLGECYGDVLR